MTIHHVADDAARSANVRTLPTLLSSLIQQVTTLLRQEGQLVRAEMSDKVARIAGCAMSIAIATALLISGLVVLLQAAVMALQMYGVSPVWSVVIVGVAVLLIGAIMLSSAIAALKKTDLVPNRTVDQLQRDAAVAKEHVR